MSVICDINPRVLRWIEMVESGEIAACREQHQLVEYVRHCFESEDIYTDGNLLENYIGMAKYFPYERLFEWEEFCVALHLCTFRKSNGMPRWPDLFLLIGRGAGKDGFIALEALGLISPYSGLPAYDVDICANAEEQAMRPVNDIRAVMESAENYKKMKQYFKWTKEYVAGIKHNGVIRGRTANPKSKDGMRSGMVVFNEIHQYSNYDNIKVFVTGLGKKKHPRRLYATTNGDVREGPLDQLLRDSKDILEGNTPDNGLLSFICRLDDKSEAENPELWAKANPSLPYLPDLQMVMMKEFESWKSNPVTNMDFMTKRMNLPQSDVEVAVTDYDNLKATDRPLPDMRGWECVCGIDYASVNDWASVDLHFRKGDERFDINHSWMCSQSKDLHRITSAWREWAANGHVTVVNNVEIPPEMICRWIWEQARNYRIKTIAMDSYRFSLFRERFEEIGYDLHVRKNLRMVTPRDIIMTFPVIESAFLNRRFTWGNNPVLRWAVNNTKIMPKSRDIGFDTGNFVYAKIEAKSRKNDPFMALVAAMTCENELSGRVVQYHNIPVIM